VVAPEGSPAGTRQGLDHRGQAARPD
jgi:hypothetical protein